MWYMLMEVVCDIKLVLTLRRGRAFSDTHTRIRELGSDKNEPQAKSKKTHFSTCCWKCLAADGYKCEPRGSNYD